jgi:hypothetical protein
MKSVLRWRQIAGMASSFAGLTMVTTWQGRAMHADAKDAFASTF